MKRNPQIEVGFKKTLYKTLKVWKFIEKERKIQILLLLFIMIISGISEIFLLGSFIPFLSVITNPEKLFEISIVRRYAEVLNLNNAKELLMPITIIFIFAVAITTFIRILNIWMIGRVAAEIGGDISIQSFGRNIYQDYLSHLKSNSSTMISTSTIQITRAINGIKEFFKIITSLTISAIILFALIYLDKSVALFSFLVFTSVYIILAFFVRKELRNNSKYIKDTSNKRIKIIQESIGGIREIILNGTQEAFLKLYKRVDRPFHILQQRNIFLGVAPRSAFQGISLIFIASFALILSIIRNLDNISIITIIGAFALGAQRLLPQLQQIYNGWSQLKNYSSDLNTLIGSIDKPLKVKNTVTPSIFLFKKLSLENVYFKYHPEGDYVLEDINLEISIGEKIGFVGSTGSGKSTLIDIVIGLLKPSKGRLLIDGIDLYDDKNFEYLSRWRNSISHVPQNIFLTDSSIAENIAFGIPKNEIDERKIRNASKNAYIDHFIEKLSNGYESNVGERGVKISGGQLQRIGIARALYRNTNVLIFDEATSALDNHTEALIMNNINNLHDEKLLIMISHRLNTLEECNRIFEMENGKLIVN